jgi:hypothetical protein
VTDDLDTGSSVEVRRMLIRVSSVVPGATSHDPGLPGRWKTERPAPWWGAVLLIATAALVLFLLVRLILYHAVRPYHRWQANTTRFIVIPSTEPSPGHL